MCVFDCSVIQACSFNSYVFRTPTYYFVATDLINRFTVHVNAHLQHSYTLLPPALHYHNIACFVYRTPWRAEGRPFASVGTPGLGSNGVDKSCCNHMLHCNSHAHSISDVDNSQRFHNELVGLQ